MIKHIRWVAFSILIFLILFLSNACSTTMEALFPLTEGSSLKLPDTGQTLSYTDIPGEDSDYTFNPPSYTDNGDGTIKDNVTGLIWQKGESGEMTWESAFKYCDGLEISGYDDWRLPVSHELHNIIDAGVTHPPLNEVFESPPDTKYWWSGTEMYGRSTNAWAINYGGGIGPKPKKETISAGGTQRYHTRCVRNTVLPDNSINIRDNGDSTASDMKTGLVWQKTDTGKGVTWADALYYCEGLSLDGYDDWRLPNLKELRSLSDDIGRSNPSIDTTIFSVPSTGSSRTKYRYWASSSLEYRPEDAWYVDFQYGLSTHAQKTESIYARCVRND